MRTLCEHFEIGDMQNGNQFEETKKNTETSWKSNSSRKPQANRTSDLWKILMHHLLHSRQEHKMVGNTQSEWFTSHWCDKKGPFFRVCWKNFGGFFCPKKELWTLCNLSMYIIDHKRIRKCYKGNGRRIGFNNLCWSAWGALNCRRDRFSDTENVPRIVFIILQFFIWNSLH